MMLRRASGQDLGASGTLVVRGFPSSVKVQFRVVAAPDARRCLLSGTQLRSMGYACALQEDGSYVMRQSSGTKGVDVT